MQRTETVEHDETEQATYLLALLDLYDSGGVDTAFVYTFASRRLPTSELPERDFDLASSGIVTIVPDRRTGNVYPGMPWEPSPRWPSTAGWGPADRSSEAATGRCRPAPCCW